MPSIQVSKQIGSRAYLKNVSIYQFKSGVDLILELFNTHIHGQKELFEIEALLEETGYPNLKEILESEIEVIKETIRFKLKDWERKEDPEYLGFRLVSAIQSKAIIVLVDNQIVDVIDMPISISPDSIISFVNNLKIEAISFTIL